MLELKPLLACPGEEIFKIGESAEGMYFIERGQVAIINGSGVTITTLNEGAFFGEMALVHNRPRGASARAFAYTELYMLDRSSFNRAMERHPEFAKTMKETTKIRESAMFAAFPLPQDLRK